MKKNNLREILNQATIVPLSLKEVNSRTIALEREIHYLSESETIEEVNATRIIYSKFYKPITLSIDIEQLNE